MYHAVARPVGSGTDNTAASLDGFKTAACFTPGVTR